ncbi:MAG: type II toxin-antitoxin system RelE/ParE family toxin [Desulfobacteraceae bacterium]|jgi:plasmid maintenance system killer protein|nr:type II toxin-antitoxin system RelE/ParE family toxin [Desulfobacteraceae bacterium]
MIIYFKTKKLQKTCSKKNETIKKHGPKMARKIHQRLMELKAATCLEDISKVPPPRCHSLSGNRKGQLSVDLEQPYRLLFIPADDPIPLMEDGGLDWAMVKKIEIIDIVDTH